MSTHGQAIREYEIASPAVGVFGYRGSMCQIVEGFDPSR